MDKNCRHYQQSATLHNIYMSCAYFGFKLITITAILYSHFAENTVYCKKKTQCQSDPHAVMII